LKIFSGGYTPGSPFKGRGGEGRKERTEGERRGLGTQLGRRGVVWDREGEEGMRVIQRKGRGREGKGREGKGREGKGGEEGRRRKMTWPPKKNSWIRHCFKLMDKKTWCNEELFSLRLKCAKIHLQASTISKTLAGLYPSYKRELLISYVRLLCK
jgi:hypothetical protein